MQNLLFQYSYRHFILFGLGLFYFILKASSQGYFQQEVNFKIYVTLNDRSHDLTGSESVEYINNSSDTLRYLYFHLWPNAYSDNTTELAKELFRVKGKGKLFDDPELRGYIDSLNFNVEGRHVKWHILPEFPDICMIILNKPLKPGDTINITTPFHVKIPKGISSRLGHIDESYQISQWYPKPAVYDRSGWHQMPYLDEAEFYSEFGSFDVSITLPENYIVGATGTLQNEKEKKWLDSLSADTFWMAMPDYDKTDFPISSEKLKTVRYTGNQIHDFAWFADKRFHVLKGKVKLPESGRDVTTWAMFTNQESPLWKDAISYINNSISFFSKNIGDYPYDSYTAVQSALNAGSGMEYPGLTVIGLVKLPFLLDEVLAHEICHSWFYSALGSDERRFPFMDESIASAYESRYMEDRYPGQKLWEISFRNRKLARFFQIEDMPVQRLQELGWLVPARNNLEQPVSLSATDYSYKNYGGIIYYKAAQGFNYLRAYLSDSLFDSIMHDYYSIWKNKHPMPEDLKEVFESRTDKNLSWFFDDFLGTTKPLDYKIVRFENQKVLIKNKGKMKSPLLITGLKGDSILSEKWEEGFEGKKWISSDRDNYSEIKIDPGHKMTELYRLNNNIRTSGIFRKADPVQLQFLYTLEDPDKRYLIFFPAVNWNSTDGFMVGLALQNATLLPKPVQYFILPFYTFRNSGFTGYGKILFNKPIYNSFIRLATLTLEGSQFGTPGNYNYRSTKIGFDINFRFAEMINPIFRKAFAYYIAASDLRQIDLLLEAKVNSYLKLGYQIERTGIINPFNMTLSSESGKSYQKTSLEFSYKYNYYGLKNGLEMRIFTGMMLKNDGESPFYSIAASGRNGSELYFYDGLYPDRFNELTSSFWSRQMTLSEGGLTAPVNDSLGYSRWLCSVSLASTLPGKASKIPVKPFVNLLLNEHWTGQGNKSPFFFEAGFKAGIWDFFEVYFPVIVSGNIESMTGSFKNRIRFIFRLDKLNALTAKL